MINVLTQPANLKVSSALILFRKRKEQLHLVFITEKLVKKLSYQILIIQFCAESILMEYIIGHQLIAQMDHVFLVKDFLFQLSLPLHFCWSDIINHIELFKKI